MLMALLLNYPLEQAVRIDQANDCIYLIRRNASTGVFRLVKGEKKEGLLFESDHFHHAVPATPADTKR